MNASIFTEVLLPLALAFIMFGMGLSLTKQDFTRLLKTPKPVVLGLFAQIILLPLAALAICLLFNLPAPLAIGLMVLSACPGGTTSNLISQLARANLALSVSLTALSTLICVFSTPFIIQYAVQSFAGNAAPEFSLLQTAIGLFVITLVPVLIGIIIRQFYQQWAIKVEVFFRRFSLVFMVAMIIGIVIKEREMLMNSFGDVFFACFALSIFTTLLGVFLAKLASLSTKDGITLGIEVGIQNATLAMLITISFLQSPEYAISAGIYGLTMYLSPLLLMLWAKRKKFLAVAS